MDTGSHHRIQAAAITSFTRAAAASVMLITEKRREGEGAVAIVTMVLQWLRVQGPCVGWLKLRFLWG